jgi:hypothetical protein
MYIVPRIKNTRERVILNEESGITKVEPSVRDQLTLAQALSKSNIVPEAYVNKPANILVAIGLGQSMGLSPAESLYRINVIRGKPTASAELIASQVRKAGHKLRIKKDVEHTSVTCTIIRKDDPDYPFSVTRDMKWAHSLGLDKPDHKGNPSNYSKQPMTMLTWRAITAAAREACPESLYGVAYSPDEMHDFDVTESSTVTVPEEQEEEAIEPDQVAHESNSAKPEKPKEVKQEKSSKLPDGMLKDMLRAAAQEIMHTEKVSGAKAAQMIIDAVGSPQDVAKEDIGSYMGKINDFLIHYRKSSEKKEEK